MRAYRVTGAVLTTYSGRKVRVDMETEIFKKPLRVVEDMILDGFVKACKDSDDPFVAIECKIKNVFV